MLKTGQAHRRPARGAHPGLPQAFDLSELYTVAACRCVHGPNVAALKHVNHLMQQNHEIMERTETLDVIDTTLILK